MERIKTNAGALPSNAGDDFHLLWAAQKILEMLKPNVTLTAVTVEGPAWQDSVLSDIEDSKLYAIDLAEYYGGTDFQSASKIVFSQLKYSTYMGDVAWTAASLCRSDNKKKDNSIIRRLADAYKEYTEKNEDSKDKLIIKFVSNRPISDSFKKSIAEAKEVLAKKNYKQASTLIKNLCPEFKIEIERLYKESNLNSIAFLSFIKMLDFEDCGTATRSIKKAEIIQQLGNWGIDSLQNKYNEIIMTIRDRMMPGRNANVAMTKDFVCSLFGGNYARFFPAPTNIPLLKTGYIERECVYDLAKIVLGQEKTPICVHATAGIGKTTLVNNMGKYLPDGSAVVFFDCYGGGTYLQPSDSRYECDTAIPQICNSLALECKTEFLLERRLKESEFFQELCIRLEHAVKYVKAFSENAIILLIIDAADNSVFAAKQNGRTCFIDKLLQQPLPKGVRLLLTYRTEHEDFFTFPDKAMFFEVPAFNLHESTEHIRSFYPSVEDETCLEFHHLSKGIPRVQAYTLTSKREIFSEVIDMLRPNGKTTEDLLNGILDEIWQRYGERNEEISLIFGVLINLPRPIPIVIATKIFGCSPEMLQSLSVDCSFGLYIENDYIYFRDEDFETFLREKYCDNLKAVSTITDYMYQHRHQDSYCAKHVHSFLALQTDISRLLNISLEESIDESLVDITEASRIMLSRIKSTLTIPVIKTQEYWKESFQLIYKIIDFSKSDESINKLIQSNPEQAYLYCDNNTLLKVFTTDRNDFDSLGKAVFIFSMKSETKTKALSYLDSYRGAINYYYSKPKEKQNPVKRPHLGDIVNVADSLLRLRDETSMRRWITSWNNKKFQANVLFEVFVQLINRNNTQMANQVEKMNWSFHCKLAIVAAYLKCKKIPPIYLVGYLIKLFNKMQVLNLANLNKDHVILFLEHLCKYDKDRNILLSIISKYQINYRISHLPYIHGDNEHELDCNIRFYVLEKTLRNENINSEDFCDKDDLKKDKRFTQKEIDERIKDIKKVYGFLLPAYTYRIQVILGGSREATELLYKDCLTKLDRLFWNDLDYQKSGSIRLYLLALSDAVLYMNTTDSHEIHTSLLKIARTAKIYRDTKFALADLCSYDRRSHQFTLETLKSISDELIQHPISAMEASEAYIQCAQIGQKVEINVGQSYFEKALQAAKGLDYESYRKLELFNVLSNVASNKGYLSDIELSHEFMRLAEDFYRKMGDSNNFPYKEVFQTATILCPKNIFSVICRLDDRNDFDHFSLPESVFYVLSELLEKDAYQLDIIASLSTILLPEQPSDYSDLAKKILKQLTKAPITVQQKSLDILIHDTLYNVPLSYKDTLAKEIIVYINDYNLFSCKNSSEITALHDFLCTTNNKDVKKQRIETEKANLPIPDMEYIQTISDSIQLVDYLKELDRDSQVKFVDLWLANTLPESYVSNANMLIEACLIGVYSIESSKIMNVFIKHICTWSVWPSVESWRNDVNIQRKIFVDHMDKILSSYHDYYDKLTRIFNVQTTDIRTFFIEYLISQDNIVSEYIIEILKKLSICLSADFAKEALKWCISTEIPSIHPLSGDKPFSDSFLHNDEELIPVCKLLWRMLGHPDKKYRWTAAHIIQNLYSCGYSSTISHLITLYHSPFDSRYMDKNNFFFEESAKIYFLVVCLRIFGEEPKEGVSFYNFFKEIACSEQTTHALQRRFAKHISLRIADTNYSGDVAQLLSSDELKLGKIKKTPRYARANYSLKQKFRFHFDTMDTLCYWYDDVADIFSLTQEEVAKDCDNYIQQFGIDNDKTRIWRDEYLHYNRYRNRNTDNRHGSLPEIETLDKYAEWHAMFYVADQYRCTLPYSEDSYKNYYDWLDSYLPGYQRYWSSEYRDHIPFIPFLWEFKKYKKPENDGEYMIPSDLIRSLIISGDNIVSYLSYNSSFDQSSQRIKIKSALINEKDIDRLICELKKPHNIFEDFDFESDPEERRYLEKTAVTIWPTCIDVDSLRDDRLDQHDPFAKDVYTNIFSFSEDIMNYCGFEGLNNVEALLLPTKNRHLPFHIAKWSEPSEEGGYEKQGTYGSIAEIEANLCLEFLANINKAIIFEYSVVFEDQTYHFYGTPSKAAKEKGIFVIRSNGITESYVLQQDSDSSYE
ncbi:P-loop NTPase family protein [Geosporobacter ferrireducens]|uniref:ATP-binding protein n=1 Tax=Geosporobacter ferrireducens TaxID=1424294 RepID=A0A1D8GBL2_9FIRM|nr:hypothetical protein [Geosporobacter ferrireducens]AOT68300.1 hypothetical protein Gferi_01070 [Geosporobacter ferrireducens]